MAMMTYRVTGRWCDEGPGARAWLLTSPDIPGLVTSAKNKAGIRRVLPEYARWLVPDMAASAVAVVTLEDPPIPPQTIKVPL